MKKQIKHGPEFAKDLNNILDRRVIRVLYFIVGFALGVLIMTFK